MEKDTKICKKCGLELSICEFFGNKRFSDGKDINCKKCQGSKSNEEVQAERNHRKTLKENGQKLCTMCNKELPIKDFGKDSYSPDGITRRCKECRKVEGKIKDDRRREKKREYDRNRKFNIKQKEKKRAREKERRKNPKNRLSNNISRLIRKSLRSNKNGKSWESVVGYSLSQLKDHIEKRFLNGMTWDNYGINGWHIDHIRPIRSFEITGYECDDFKKCWSLENLRPLWATDNHKKGGKWETN